MSTIKVRKANERGHASESAIESHYTFSFADEYYDPEFMGFGPLRAINEHHLRPGAPIHMRSDPDMEIVTWLLDGALEDRKSVPAAAALRPGEAQRISTGAGQQDHELNAGAAQPAHFLQIWILPEHASRDSKIDRKSFPVHERRNQLRLIGCRDGRDGTVRISSQVDIYAALLTESHIIEFWPAQGHRAWLQVASGTVHANGNPLEAGDGAALVDEARIKLRAFAESEILLFDMAAR